MNSLPYSYEITKEVAEKWNKSDKKIGIKEAENKCYYLPVGKYKVTCTLADAAASSTFEIKLPKSKKLE
jgi:hypothetical protein